MARIENYEVFFTALPVNGEMAPIVVLSFAWSDAVLRQAGGAFPRWTPENSKLVLVEEGLSLETEGEDALLFPLSLTEQVEGGPLNRDTLLGAVAEHGGLHVCAFDEDGEPLVSLGFQIQAP